MLPVLRERRYELAFLPAALEIVESPPSPLGRAIGASIIAIFGLALAWACIGGVDIVASAQGKIVPSGRTKVLQPFETGVVRAIHVRDGQNVKAGDLLIDIDSTISEAERNRSKSDLTSVRLDIARLRAALAQSSDPLADFKPPEDASPSLIEMQKKFLVNQLNEHRAKLSTLDQQEKQKEAELATIDATVGKLRAITKVAEERVEVRKALWDQQLGSKLLYLTDLQDLVGQQQELHVQESKYHETEAASAAIAATREQTAAEFNRSLSSDLATAEQKASALEQDVVKAEEHIRLQQLTAPIDGVVQQLAVHTVGGIVTTAQALLTVVPSDSQLEIEAMVSNRDIGFVHAGQDAEIKIDTFNFTRYGLLHGKVLSVSQDSITREKGQGQDRSENKSPGAESSSSEPQGQELVYAARVSLDRTHMQIDENKVRLSPGMAVTVEIKTGTRRIIGYLLSPLVRYGHDTLRER
jgi:hemolysin D